MSLFRNLLERRTLTPAQLFGIGAEAFGGSTAAGVRVDQDTAIKLVAVSSAVRLVSNAIGGLPVHAFRPEGKARRRLDPQPTWISDPDPRDPSVTRIEHFAQVTYSLVLDSNSFTLCLPSVTSPGIVMVMNPRRVSVGKGVDGVPYYDILDERGTVIERVGPERMIHIPLMRRPGTQRGQSLIESNQQAIGLGLAAEEYGARFFGNGATMSGIIEYPTGVDPTPDQVTKLLGDINKAHRGTKKAHAIGALTNGATYRQLSINPDSAQFLETQRWVLEQVGRMVGLPPHKQGSQEPGAVSYNSVEIRNIDYVNDALMPLSGRIELAYGRLLPRPDDYLKFQFDALLRGDVKTRWAAYESALRWGVYDLDEIRAMEDENPIEGGLGSTRPFPLTYAPLDRVRALPLPVDPPGPRPAPDSEDNQ